MLSLEIRIQAKNDGSESILLIIRHVMVCSNYLNRQSVVETILVMDNGGHGDAILHKLRFVFSRKIHRASHNTATQESNESFIFIFDDEYSICFI
jgi:hypothetical protein